MSKTPSVASDLYPPDRILAVVETALGRRVDKITLPGGRKRPVYRVFLDGESIIAVHRKDPARAEKERMVLTALTPHCAVTPRFLGMADGLLLQSDAGVERLNRRIYEVPRADRVGLAERAVEAIASVQDGARQAGLAARLDPILAAPGEVEDFAARPFRLARMIDTAPPEIDVAALARAITPQSMQFVKWDCRAGNAAIGADGTLGWFDFEYAATRHGAEDYAWLAADEQWPIGAEDMRRMVADRAAAASPDPDAFMRVFDIYTTLQAVLRLRVILLEAHKRGWVDQLRALRNDYVGTDPYLGRRLAEKAAHFADRDALTRPILPAIEATGRLFQRVIDEAAARKTGA